MSVREPGPERRRLDEPSRPPLRGKERRQVERRTAPRAAVIYEAIRREGEIEIRRTAAALLWSGLAAGLSMGFSLLAEGALHARLPDAPWRPLVSKLGYSVGFLIVILGRQQLFTENTLTPVLPFLSKPRRQMFIRVMRLWGIVLAANIAGAFLFAWGVARSGIFEPDLRRSFSEIALEVVDKGFGELLLLGVFAGWLIALMVWLLPLAEYGRIWIVLVLTYLIGIAGLSHIIAGAVEGFYIVATGESSWRQFLGGFAAPTLIGNVIGGVALVAALNHGQVMSENHATIE